MITASIERKWIKCPHCGAKNSIYDNTANCNGVFLKCTRGCKREFELVIVEGEQVLKNNLRPRTVHGHVHGQS